MSLVRVPLLPKLRGYFAEFLKLDSLTRLSLLDSPTCVGFGYGHKIEESDCLIKTQVSANLKKEV